MWAGILNILYMCNIQKAYHFSMWGKNLLLLLLKKEEEGESAFKIVLGLWKSIVCQNQTWYLLESIFSHVRDFSTAT